eukprot:4946185-Amphidinium_carterae.1
MLGSKQSMKEGKPPAWGVGDRQIPSVKNKLQKEASPQTRCNNFFPISRGFYFESAHTSQNIAAL